MGEMPVVCKKWLTGVILNICRSVQNRVEQAVEALRSILSLVVNHPRPANANDRVAAEAAIEIVRALCAKASRINSLGLAGAEKQIA